MNVRLSLVAIVAALAVALPATVVAKPITVTNNTDGWVLFNMSFPPPPKTPSPAAPPSARCFAPGEEAAEPISASRIGQVYIIALSGDKCYAPRLWEHGVKTEGKGATIAVGHSAATMGHNASDTVRIKNESAAWALVSVLLLPPPPPPPTPRPPSQTTWCIDPSATITTPDMPDNGRGYVIVLAHAACNAPRLFEEKADGGHIRVNGKSGSYTVEARP